KDNAAVTSSLNTFIKAYNDTLKVIKDLGNYDAANKKASTLTGDSTLRASQAQLRSVLFAASGGSNANLQRLSDLGVSIQTDGTLKMDSTKLSAAITSDFANVALLVADVGSRFKTTVSGLISADGSVTARIDGINSTVKDIGKRREAISLSLQKIESNYRRQFNALDLQVANLQALSARLTQQLASLPSFKNN
ncbi:MAG: flagellar filament capping protein FliD, partial [Propionivibrio sp.]|uniref:flagellar filament capping protein FliD n=1 Tax=Propionivibrio sp. TaxID=2212460 RepID=UPI001A5ECB15